jgi:hypothetical protein
VQRPPGAQVDDAGGAQVVTTLEACDRALRTVAEDAVGAHVQAALHAGNVVAAGAEVQSTVT